MSKCDDCQIDYPDGYVSDMIGFSPNMGGSFIKFVCSICALAISNRVHNENRTKFDGKIAELMRIKAIKFREELKEK